MHLWLCGAHRFRPKLWVCQTCHAALALKTARAKSRKKARTRCGAPWGTVLNAVPCGEGFIGGDPVVFRFGCWDPAPAVERSLRFSSGYWNHLEVVFQVLMLVSWSCCKHNSQGNEPERSRLREQSGPLIPLAMHGYGCLFFTSQASCRRG